MQATVILRREYGKNIKLLEFMERANDEMQSVPQADFQKLIAMMVLYYGK